MGIMDIFSKKATVRKIICNKLIIRNGEYVLEDGSIRRMYESLEDVNIRVLKKKETGEVEARDIEITPKKGTAHIIKKDRKIINSVTIVKTDKNPKVVEL